MGQGQGCCVLLRAYIQTGEKKYLDAATRAIDFMLLPTSDGGTMFEVDNEVFLRSTRH